MTLSKGTLAVLTVLLIAGAVSAFLFFRGREDPVEEQNVETTDDTLRQAVVASVQEQFSTSTAQRVRGAVVVRDTLWIKVTGEGRASAFRQARLSAMVEGQLTELPVRENEAVRGGALLAGVDTTEYALEALAAAAALSKARVDYEARILAGAGVQDEGDRARREALARDVVGLPQAEVEHQRALLRLEKTRVAAPFEGRVADLKVVAGQYVRPGDELLTLVDIDPIKVEVEVLGTEAVHLEEGRRTEVRFNAFPDTVFRGLVRTINPVVDPERRTVRVTIHLDNPSGRIKPGMFAEAVIEARQLPDRILVPVAALLERPNGEIIFVLEDGRSKWRYVTRGQENDDFVELLEGEDAWAAPGEIVLIDGHHYLPHDALVELIEEPWTPGTSR